MFPRGQYNVPDPSRVGNIAVGFHVDCCMIHFAAYTATETPNVFQWAGQPAKLPLPVGISTPI